MVKGKGGRHASSGEKEGRKERGGEAAGDEEDADVGHRDTRKIRKLQNGFSGNER